MESKRELPSCLQGVHRALMFEEIIYKGGAEVSVIFTCADCDKELMLTGEPEER